MDVAVRKTVFLMFCTALSIAGFFCQAWFLASSNDLSARTEWTRKPELLVCFLRLENPLETRPSGSFGNVLSGTAGNCRFQIFGADFSGGTGNYFASFLNNENDIV